jgi:hypothetical protein
MAATTEMMDTMETKQEPKEFYFKILSEIILEVQQIIFLAFVGTSELKAVKVEMVGIVDSVGMVAMVAIPEPS